MTDIYGYTMNSIEGEPIPLSRYKDKVCLVVNLASQWGLTPQYAGLRTLQEKYESQGFTVLGFPCNQFGAQEPGTDAEIAKFAQDKFDVNFPLFSKIEVNGDGACELYKNLRTAQPEADGKEDLPWNFTKFLVGRNGEALARFGPQMTPEEIAKVLPEHL